MAQNANNYITKNIRFSTTSLGINPTYITAALTSQGIPFHKGY